MLFSLTYHCKITIKTCLLINIQNSPLGILQAHKNTDDGTLFYFKKSERSPRSGRSSAKSSASSVCSMFGELSQLKPLHSPHAREQSNPCLRQVHTFDLQSPLQLHRMNRSRKSGAGGSSVVRGSSCPEMTCQSQNCGSRFLSRWIHSCT